MLKKALAGKLPAELISLIPRSFDVIGDIAIIELPSELRRKEKLIGTTLLSLLKNVKVVAVEVGEHTGVYRRQKLRVIAGDKRFTTMHKESGVALELNVSTCYYSPRLASERLRIATLVKPGERVLVAGSGIGVYPLVIAKHSKAAEIVGVEINPSAHSFAAKNIVRNKCSDRVKAIKGDAFTQKLGTFDRIILAMPTFGVACVPQLLPFVKRGTLLHILDFAQEEDLNEPATRLKKICKENKHLCRIIAVVKAGQPGIRRYRVSVDAKIT